MAEPLKRHDTRPILSVDDAAKALEAGVEVVVSRLPERPRWPDAPGWPALRRLFHGFADIERRALLARLLLEEGQRLARDAACGMNFRPTPTAKVIPGSTSADDGGKS
jgi:hypothetical protein